MDPSCARAVEENWLFGALSSHL